MNRRLFSALGIVGMALAGTACSEANEAIQKVDETVVSEDVTGVGQEQLALVRDLAKTDAGLAALEKAGYVATAAVTTEEGTHYLRFKVCDKSATPQACRKTEAPTQKTPDVHINLSQAPTNTKIAPNGTYDLAYPVGNEGLKYRYLCFMQGVSGPDQTTGLTKAVVSEFSAIGAVVVDAASKAQTVGDSTWRCNHQVLKENFS